MTCKVDLDPTQKHWKLLYLAAIREKDKSVLGKRISDAEHAIFLREHEIFYAGTTREEREALEEKEALEDALCALRALQGAREHSDPA
jgi:hypothetical protein